MFLQVDDMNPFEYHRMNILKDTASPREPLRGSATNTYPYNQQAYSQHGEPLVYWYVLQNYDYLPFSSCSFGDLDSDE